MDVPLISPGRPERCLSGHAFKVKTVYKSWVSIVMPVSASFSWYFALRGVRFFFLEGLSLFRSRRIPLLFRVAVRVFLRSCRVRGKVLPSSQHILHAVSRVTRSFRTERDRDALPSALHRKRATGRTQNGTLIAATHTHKHGNNHSFQIT
jgi:hypothetical protein